MQRTWMNGICFSLVLFVSITLWAYPFVPQKCILCDSLRYHAPCLVSISTGEMEELAIYQPHPEKVAEIAPDQTGSVFRLLRIAEATGHCDTAAQTLQVSFPVQKSRISAKHFCKPCRNALAGCKPYGYALVDMYEADSPRILPLIDGVCYKLRCYEISVQQKGANMKITVLGTALPAAA